MTTPIDVETSFCQSMANAGITTGGPLLADGRLHRFHVEGDRSGSKNGWYVLYPDDIAAGAFGCWKRGISETWCAKATSSLSPQQRETFTRRMEAAKVERERERKRVHAEAQAYAQKIWEDSKSEPGTHPYLTKKKVKVHGLRLYKGSLVIPLRDSKGVIHSLQFIDGNGGKRFLTGGRVSGCYFPIGQPNGVVHIAEGFSTAATVREVTGEAVAMAFNAGNLKSVAQAIHKKLPDIKIIIAGDTDAHIDGNPGREKALEAARAVGALVALPEFQNGQAGTDFNDLCMAEGQQAVKEQLEAAAPPPLSDGSQAEIEAWFKSDSTDPESIREALQALPLVHYDRLRKKVAEHADIRVATLDELVNVSRESKAEVQGGTIGWGEIIPWPEPVNGTGLLDELVTTFQRYIILPEGAAETIALWILHTHCHEATFISPYLVLTSPEKRCGKTLTLELLSNLVLKPLPASNISPSSLFRAVDKWRPTLLIDEADTFLRRNDELAGILNSGHTRTSSFVLRTVGDDFEPRRFSTWAPKAIALIGSLKDTLRDRSIIVTMRRKTSGEGIERLRLDKTGEFEIVRRKVVRWASDHFDVIKSIDPEVPRILNDRQQDNWRPLLSIADIAGGEWPAKARQTAETISSSGDIDNDSIRVQLLEDIRGVFEKAGSPETMKTVDLLTALNGAEDRPWCESRKGQPMSARSLSTLLRPFRVTPKTIRFSGEELKKGYYQNAFTDVFSRYLPTQPVTSVTSNNINNLQDGLSVTKAGNVTDKTSRKSSKHTNVTDVTDRNPLPGENKGQEAFDSSFNLVQCGECRYFVPNPKDAEKGVGECAIDAPFTNEDPPKPSAYRKCLQFEAKALPAVSGAGESG